MHCYPTVGITAEKKKIQIMVTVLPFGKIMVKSFQNHAHTLLYPLHSCVSNVPDACLYSLACVSLVSCKRHHLLGCVLSSQYVNPMKLATFTIGFICALKNIMLSIF
jgi:hypothetical protein